MSKVTATPLSPEKPYFDRRNRVWERIAPVDEAWLPARLREYDALVYRLIFDNGERYIGRTADADHRIPRHLVDTKQHLAWRDVSEIHIMSVDREILLDAERKLTAEERGRRIPLRNLDDNDSPSLPAPELDELPIVDQRHWAAGDRTYGADGATDLALRKAAMTSLERSALGRRRGSDGRSVAERVFDDLGAVLDLAVPNAVQHEDRYWAIADNPGAPERRFTTFYIGAAELVSCPRSPEKLDHRWSDDSVYPVSMATVVSFVKGSLTHRFDLKVSGLLTRRQVGLIDEEPIVAQKIASKNDSSGVDQLVVPLGSLRNVLEDFALVGELREYVLAMMQRSTAARHADSHSKAMATMAYRAIAVHRGLQVPTRAVPTRR